MAYQNNRINNLKYLEPHRKRLRNNPTEAEETLWHYIRKKKIAGRRFRRQFSIANYILDFYCVEEKITVELDGKYHFDKEGVMIDFERDAFLKAQGVTILRFENWKVFEDLKGVLAEIESCFRENRL